MASSSACTDGGELMRILDDIGLGHLKAKFRENLITLDQVKYLSEEDFARLGVTAIGIKLKIKTAVEDYNRVNGCATTSSVVSKFMDLQQKKSLAKTVRNVANKKSSRRVRVGWKHLISPGKYKVMTGRDGGGIQIVDLDKDWTIGQAIRKILGIFFPGGKSVNFKLAELDYYLASFANQRINDGPDGDASPCLTVAQYFDQVQSHPVRWYLHTQLKHAAGEGSDCRCPLKRTADKCSHGEDDDLPEIRRKATAASTSRHEDDDLPEIRRKATAASTSRHEDVYNSDDDLPEISRKATAASTSRHDEDVYNSDDDLPEIRRKATAASTSRHDEGESTQMSVSDEALVEEEAFVETDTPTISFKRRPQFVRRQRPELQQDAYSSYVDLVTVSSEDESESESDIVQVQETSAPKKQPAKLFDVLGALEIRTGGLPTKFNIIRSDPLDGARRAVNRKTFVATNYIDVRFADDVGISEGAVDSGGPTRELFRLLLQNIKTCVAFQGDDHSKQFALQSEALRSGLYRDIGVLVSMAITHGGQWPGFFHPTAYHSFAYKEPAPSTTVDDICDLELKDMVNKLQQASSLLEMDEVVNDNYTIFTISGCYQPMVRFSEMQRDQIVKDVLQFLVVGRNQQAITQFSEGLQACGILEAVQEHPDLFLPVFCQGPPALTAENVEAMFSCINYSEEGSNNRQKEQRVYTYWCDFLMDVEDGKVNLTLEELLAFSTGSNQVPFLGFGTDPTLEFDHVHTKYPTANTCGLSLRLPVVSNYQTFAEGMVFGIRNSPGFGKA